MLTFEHHLELLRAGAEWAQRFVAGAVRLRPVYLDRLAAAAWSLARTPSRE